MTVPGRVPGPPPRSWPTVLASAYVVVVAGVALLGFAADSTAAILLAAALAIPASVLAVPGFYLFYGLLAQVPGANPSRSSGSASCTPAGDCTTIGDGEPAAWFLVTTDVVGVVALVAAAVFNVIAVRRLWGLRERGMASTPSS